MGICLLKSDYAAVIFKVLDGALSFYTMIVVYGKCNKNEYSIIGPVCRIIKLTVIVVNIRRW